MGDKRRRFRVEIVLPSSSNASTRPTRDVTTCARGRQTPWTVTRVASLPLLLNTEAMFIEGDVVIEPLVSKALPIARRI